MANKHERPVRPATLGRLDQKLPPMQNPRTDAITSFGYSQFGTSGVNCDKIFLTVVRDYAENPTRRVREAGKQ